MTVVRWCPLLVLLAACGDAPTDGLRPTDAVEAESDEQVGVDSDGGDTERPADSDDVVGDSDVPPDTDVAVDTDPPDTDLPPDTDAPVDTDVAADTDPPVEGDTDVPPVESDTDVAPVESDTDVPPVDSDTDLALDTYVFPVDPCEGVAPARTAVVRANATVATSGYAAVVCRNKTLSLQGDDGLVFVQTGGDLIVSGRRVVVYAADRASVVVMPGAEVEIRRDPGARVTVLGGTATDTTCDGVSRSSLAIDLSRIAGGGC